jgi:hypothetical protein
VPGDESYERGHAAGEIAARLAGHDRHFAAINGSLADLAREMHGLVLAVQRLGDQADATAKTTISTAAALASADQARRDLTERRWSPFQKLIAVIGCVLGVAGFLYLVLHR